MKDRQPAPHTHGGDGSCKACLGEGLSSWTLMCEGQSEMGKLIHSVASTNVGEFSQEAPAKQFNS